MSESLVRSRRLRKKLYVDEFAIIGFQFTCQLKEASDEEYRTFFDGFADLVDGRHLFINLEGDIDELHGYVTSGDRYGNATEEDRQAVEQLLNGNPLVVKSEVGSLVDAIYGL